MYKDEQYRPILHYLYSILSGIWPIAQAFSKTCEGMNIAASIDTVTYTVELVCIRECISSESKKTHSTSGALSKG